MFDLQLGFYSLYYTHKLISWVKHTDLEYSSIQINKL